MMSDEVFGRMPDGRPVREWTLERAGVRVRCMEYGAAIRSIEVPDRTGCVADIALGYDTLDPYLTRSGCLGAVVGRFANRIRHGRFELDGVTYQLPLRPNGLHLHGGNRGFDKCCWSGEADSDGRKVRFSLVSPDGDEGYPGTCRVSVTYSLTDRHELEVAFTAETDAPTPINLSQHCYFNLAGHQAGDVLGHRVQLHAQAFTAVDDAVIPTGEIRDVRGTPLDFTAPHPIGERIDLPYEQLVKAGGYDHNFVVAREGDGLARVARVEEPTTGRTLDVESTEPGVQFYTGNSLNGSQVGKGGHAYHRRHGFCLETQHYPDSPNIRTFPPTILRPGETFASRTLFRFGVA